MAESDIQKDEWISTVNNIGYDSVHAQPRMNTKKDEAVIRLEREKIRSWVNKEIDPKKDKSSVPKIPKVSPTPTPSTSTSQISAFPSLSTFLNFLDPTSQSNQSENPPQKKSPIFQRKASSNPKPIETSGGDFGGVSIPHPKELPSPLQPERLTAGAVSASSRQNQFSYSKSFSVKYLGHMEVPEGRNISVITDTIQKVMTARAVRNVKDSQAIEMTVSNKSISLYDNHAKKPIGQILLKDILRCAVQPESIKLFGVVNRTTEGDKVKFICHVMEANTTGSQVCSAINEAIQSAIKMIQAGTKHARSRSGNVATRSLRESVEHPSPSRQAPKNATESKPPSRPPPPKPKSTSDSNILSTVSNPLPSSITSSQSSLNSALSDDSTDAGPMAPPPPMSSGYLPNPTPVFNTMPLLPENKATTNPPGQGGMGGSSSVHVPQQNGTSSPQSNGNNTVSWNMMSAAASSSDYYQMPSTLQGGGAASQGGGVTSQGGGMPVMDSFSDGDLDSPLPPLDDLVSSPTTSDPYGSGGERKETSASVSVDSGYFQMPHMQHSADTSSQLATPVMGGSGSVDSGSSYLASPMMGVSGSVDSGSASFAAGGGSGSVDSGSAYFIAPGSTSSTLNGSGSVDSGSAYIFAPNATSSILNGSGSVDSGSASKPALGGSGCADSGGNGLVDSGSSLKPPLFGGSGLVDSGSAYLPAPGVTSDGIGGNNVVSANGFEDPGCLSSSDTVFDVSSSSQQSAGFDAIFGGGVASTSNSGYLPAPMGAESASATPNQSAESFFTPGNVSSSSVGGFPGSFPGMGGGAEGEEDLDDFDLPPLPDSVEPLPPTGQGGVSSYGGSFVTFGSTRTQH